MVGSSRAKSYLPEISFGTKTGAAMIEDATKERLDTRLLFGMELEAGLLINPANILHLGIHYVRPLNKEDAGSEQVRVKRTMQLINLLLQYERRFKKISILAGFGPSLAVITTVFRLYDLNDPYVEIDGSEGTHGFEGAYEVRYYFPEKKRVLVSKERGIEPGVLVDLGLAVDVGEFMGIEPDFFSVTFRAEYVRRNQRNELFGLFSINLTPTVLIKKP